MSAHITNDNNNRDTSGLPCPACIEAASEKRGEDELVPAYALETYTFDQLAAHLESNTHDQRDLVAVCLRASIYLYRQAFALALKELQDLQ